LWQQVIPVSAYNFRNPHHQKTEAGGGDTENYKHSHGLLAATSTKSALTLKHPEINTEYFTTFTRNLLSKFYPKTCPKCGHTTFKTIRTRETELRCSNCNTHISLTSYTPCHHLKTPLWVFGYVFYEALNLHPQPLTTSHIARKLGVGNGTANTLKRRLQLFMSDLMPAVKKIMNEMVSKDFDEDYRLPHKDVDITAEIQGKNVVFSDTLALFSVSRRCNGYRSRYKHNGQTSSIYLSDEVALEKGKYQIGTLVHTLAIKKGPVIFTSVRDQRQESIEPLLDFLPTHAPHFSDDGFPFFQRTNNNYRAVNHTARAKNGKRNVWARNRWSKNGVHNQTAEGMNRVLKSYMRTYSYIRPEYSQLYLNEFCALRLLQMIGCGGRGLDSIDRVFGD